MAVLSLYMSLDQKLFASGSFRDAYKASVISGLPSSNANGYTVKRFKEDQVYEIEPLFGTVEAHTRKMVQINSLARNLALQMSLDAPEQFGDTFTYTKVYFGKINGEVITLEKYLDGNFEKHINNTGEIYTESELGKKCEAFVHYTCCFKGAADGG